MQIRLLETLTLENMEVMMNEVLMELQHGRHTVRRVRVWGEAPHYSASILYIPKTEGVEL